MKYFFHYIFILFFIQALNLSAKGNESDLKIAILYDDEFLLHHTGPNHPENSDRITHATFR